MRKIFIATLFLSLSFLAACAGDHLAPDWRVDGPRILAIQAEQPVFSPGDAVDFSLLLAGVDILGRSNATVEWGMGNILQSLPADRKARFDLPAAADIDTSLGADVAGQYTATGKAFVELRVLVRLADGTTLPARKRLLLAKPSIVQSLKYNSPFIEQIVADIDQDKKTVEAGTSIYISPSAKSGTVTLSANLRKYDSIKAYGYRWYVEATMANEKPSIKNDAASATVEIGIPQFGPLTVHLIVEDRSEELADALYQGGLDFVSFTVAVGSDTSDADALLTEEDITDDVVVDNGPLVDDDLLLAD